LEDEKIKQIIRDTVATTVQQLQAAGLLQDSSISAYKKTEMLLRQYPELKKSQEPYARRVVQEIDACLADAANEPYVKVIQYFYFEGMKNSACAARLICDERTARRNRTRLVQQFSARLASDDFIRELLR
jgi:hypothetical protein